MTTYDGVMAGLVVSGMVWGAVRGFSWGIASLGALVAGYSCALWGSAYLSPFLALNLPGGAAAQRSGSMLLAFSAVSGACLFAAWSARATLRKMKFELYDRHLGVLLGGAEAALLGLIGTMFVASLAPQSREPIFSGRAGHLVARMMDAAGPVIPAEIRNEINRPWDGGPVSISESDQPPVASDPVRAGAGTLGLGEKAFGSDNPRR